MQQFKISFQREKHRLEKQILDKISQKQHLSNLNQKFQIQKPKNPQQNNVEFSINDDFSDSND